MRTETQHVEITNDRRVRQYVEDRKQTYSMWISRRKQKRDVQTDNQSDNKSDTEFPTERTCHDDIHTHAVILYRLRTLQTAKLRTEKKLGHVVEQFIQHADITYTRRKT